MRGHWLQHTPHLPPKSNQYLFWKAADCWRGFHKCSPYIGIHFECQGFLPAALWAEMVVLRSLKPLDDCIWLYFSISKAFPYCKFELLFRRGIKIRDLSLCLWYFLSCVGGASWESKQSSGKMLHRWDSPSVPPRIWFLRNHISRMMHLNYQNLWSMHWQNDWISLTSYCLHPNSSNTEALFINLSKFLQQSLYALVRSFLSQVCIPTWVLKILAFSEHTEIICEISFTIITSLR